jgi:hypothetical protein
VDFSRAREHIARTVPGIILSCSRRYAFVCMNNLRLLYLHAASCVQPTHLRAALGGQLAAGNRHGRRCSLRHFAKSRVRSCSCGSTATPPHHHRKKLRRERTEPGSGIFVPRAFEIRFLIPIWSTNMCFHGPRWGTTYGSPSGAV